MSNDRFTMTLMRIAVTLIFLLTFLLAAIGKWIDGGAPEWFINQFSETWMGSFPQTPMYLSIALLESLIAIGAIISLCLGEWFKTEATVLKYTLVASLFMFIILGFGARTAGDFDAAASHFFYFSGTLLALVVIDRDERLAAVASTT
jgi:hypothetical protein